MEKLLSEIHRRFRLAMNGVVSTSMRAKGMPYKVNFGVSLPQMKQIAARYTPDAALARRLWSEDIRESRLLATFLMPHADFPDDEALRWMRQANTPELSDFLAMNLLQHLPRAGELTLRAIESSDVSAKRSGYALAGRLFLSGQRFSGDPLSAYIRAAAGDLPHAGVALSGNILQSLRCAVRDPEAAQAILAAFAPDTPIGEELRFECDYYRGNVSDM